VIVYVWFSGLSVCDAQTFECVVKIDEDQWMYDNICNTLKYR